MLKKQYLTQIRSNKRLKVALMNYFDISNSTLYRWMDENDRSFTEYNCLQLIAAYLKVDDVQDMLESAEQLHNN
jgi:hypothetical protein